jgi:SAM-dependent methyltransferase
MTISINESHPVAPPAKRWARIQLGLLRPWPTSADAQRLLALYRGAPLMVRTELRYRLNICPFEEVERRVPPDARVLDLGCGYALLSNLIALGSDARQVTGMDTEAVRVQTAAATISARANVRFVQGDVTVAPFDAPTCIVMNDVLHHIPHDRQIPLLRKCFAALPPGGLMLIKDVDKDVAWKYLWNYFHDAIKNGHMPFFCLDSAILSVLLDLVGFQVEVLHLDTGYPYSHVLYVCQKPG